MILLHLEAVVSKLRFWLFHSDQSSSLFKYTLSRVYILIPENIDGSDRLGQDSGLLPFRIWKTPQGISFPPHSGVHSTSLSKSLDGPPPGALGQIHDSALYCGFILQRVHMKIAFAKAQLTPKKPSAFFFFSISWFCLLRSSLFADGKESTTICFVT